MGEFIDKAVSFTKAMAVQIAAGCAIAGKWQQKERHDICGQCPFLLKEEYKCGVCKCNLFLKIPLATSECPKQYWGKVTPEKEDNNE